MKIRYFCYRLSGTGPRTRAADIINGVAQETDHEVAVMTNEPNVIRASADVHEISLRNPMHLLSTARQVLADADVVHVPINVYQVFFVRLLYGGPLVAGVGPGIQSSLFHRLLGRLLGIDVKVKVHKEDNRWDAVGYDTAICTATIDRNQFYPYEDNRIRELRAERGIADNTNVILYVGRLNEEYGARLFSKLASLNQDDDRLFVAIGDGPLADEFHKHENILYEGFVQNQEMPNYYNIADITVIPRKDDNTSNVGLESISCGTPAITTAEGTIETLFKDRGTYVWADRTAEDILATIENLLADSNRYETQRDRGLQTINEMELTLDTAIETHQRVYQQVVKGS